MPGGFLKKLGTASCGITGTLVAVALVCAETGRDRSEPISTSAATSATNVTTLAGVSERVRRRFMATASRDNSRCSDEKTFANLYELSGGFNSRAGAKATFLLESAN